MARRRARPDPFAPRRFEPLEPPTAPEAMSRRRDRTVAITPVTHIVPQRGSRLRVEDDPFFFPQENPGMLQEYGDAADLHTMKGVGAADRADILANRSFELMRKGDCIAAQLHLVSAHHHLGAASAHASSGGQRFNLTNVERNVDRADFEFTQACKVSKRRK